MKSTLHFKTGDFEFIELEVEGSEQEIIDQYRKFNTMFNGGEGLTQKEWNEVLDRYLNGDGMSEEAMTKMSKVQSWAIHEIDKSNTRRDNN